MCGDKHELRTRPRIPWSNGSKKHDARSNVRQVKAEKSIIHQANDEENG